MEEFTSFSAQLFREEAFHRRVAFHLYMKETLVGSIFAVLFRINSWMHKMSLNLLSKE